jgi:threonylcarbamoyladenosine tRNA methylthiotransferase MtaB
LIEALLSATSLCRLRLSSLEPMDATEELIGLMAANPGRLCAHLHLPLQSGSDAVLARMMRPYTSAAYAERVAYARSRLPQLALSSDIIVGFPGEDEPDFAKTVSLCRQMGFMRLHVFRYSPRRLTPAASHANQVPAAIKAERAARLRSLADELALADLDRRIGQRELVLVEQPGLGRSDSYHQVLCDRALAIGSLFEACFCSHRDKLLECQ